MSDALRHINTKVFSWSILQRELSQWKQAGDQIVFTNGCFDLIHYGHLHYLAEARNLGDRLVVGLNSDASVKRLKGKHRPIKDQLTRQLVLASFVFIDGVTLFEQDDPLDLITLLKPDILVKGGDWAPEQIIGADVVLANGGQVLSLPYISGHSTTSLESKIKASQKEN